MPLKYSIFRNLYQDSVSLMQISSLIGKLPGIEAASVVMGTENNLKQLQAADLDQGINASPNDLIIVVRGEENACDQALEMAQKQLTSQKKTSTTADTGQIACTSIEMAFDEDPSANLVLISVPGDYAAAEAIKALNLGLNVMLFSDNVSIEHEKQIKLLAQEKNLLVMGPDCGTAIINGIPLGFANKVARGKIGIIAASGTGLQEVSCRIDQLGEGVSQAIGTGGHDLSEDIGGITMLSALDLLEKDQKTEIIILVSKPPAVAIAEKILKKAEAIKKHVVVHFLGASNLHENSHSLIFADTLVNAAEQGVSLLQNKKPIENSNTFSEDDIAILKQVTRTLSPKRRYIRGIFAGGTFCYESQLISAKAGITGFSNTPIKNNVKLNDIWHSQEHTWVDMGDDDFTRGKPHPMIDPSLRNQRILEEIKHPETAVVLFDLVLGYGATLDPSTELLKVINDARANQQDLPIFIAHVCGTEADIQGRSQQIQALKDSNILVASSNAQAAQWSSFIAKQSLEGEK